MKLHENSPPRNEELVAPLHQANIFTNLTLNYLAFAN